MALYRHLTAYLEDFYKSKATALLLTGRFAVRLIRRKI